MQPYMLSITEAAGKLRSKELSPVELVQSVLNRIAEVEARLHAFATVTAERAMEAARQAEKEMAAGNYRGPLHGIPIGIKDLYDTAGIPTTCSSKVRADCVPQQDSACVEMLRKAGAVLVGKTHTHEFAYGVITPTTRNPWDTQRVPGGSSGGSAAAVAAGEALMAMGSDTGGSIRIPASVCGVVGLKPTYGRVSKFGLASLSWSLDHAGPLTRTVRDAAVVLNAVAGRDPRDPTTADVPVPGYTVGLDGGVTGMTLGVPANHYFDDIDPQVEAAVRAAIGVLESQGARLREVRLPLAEYYLAVAFGIVVPEASAYHQQMLRDRAELYQDDVRVFLEAGEMVLATDYIKAIRVRHLVKQGWKQVFDGLNALVAPSLPTVAAKIGQEKFTWPSGAEEPVINAYVRLSCPANITGLPAISVPCGFNTDGLPIGLQIIARPFDEATVLRVAQAYEASTNWRSRTPLL